jgi:hypothetical protein
MMIRLFLLFVLAVAGAAVQAEFVLFYRMPNSEHFVNWESLKMAGPYRSVWTMENFYERQDDGSVQRRREMQFDCGQRKVRRLRYSYWSDLMSDPRSVFSSNQEPTSFVNVDKAGSLSDILFRDICSK